MIKVPFANLPAQYLSIKPEIDAAIAQVLESGAFIGGEPVRQFEADFGKFLGVKHIIGCGNGTDALEILLTAMGIGTGDDVLVPAISWIATSEAVTTADAKPVFVDVEPDFYTMDAAKAAEKISPVTTAVIPVHLYGQPADLQAVRTLADKLGLLMLEDCAQAHGASQNGQLTGTIGEAAAFSFYPGKNLGAYGDAGAMATNNPDTAKQVRMIANHGQLQKHHHQFEGRNSRLDGLQAAVLSVKLKHLEKWTKQRIALADNYFEQLKDLPGLTLPKVRTGSRHVFHLFVVLAEKRDELREFLHSRGIETARHYPTALPFLPCYRHLDHHPDDFPVAYRLQCQGLSLPLYPEMTEAQQQWVVDSIREFYG
ncbi:MAG: DegT/DnrJ/EryC1/StrS family aminotransferase [Bacteroidia bacterium]